MSEEPIEIKMARLEERVETLKTNTAKIEGQLAERKSREYQLIVAIALIVISSVVDFLSRGFS